MVGGMDMGSPRIIINIKIDKIYKLSLEICDMLGNKYDNIIKKIRLFLHIIKGRII